jgi:hypothetical protein
MKLLRQPHIQHEDCHGDAENRIARFALADTHVVAFVPSPITFVASSLAELLGRQERVSALLQCASWKLLRFGKL